MSKRVLQQSTVYWDLYILSKRPLGNFIARGGLDTFNDDRTYFFHSFQVMELTLEDTKTL
jgi:hypothetical protein